MKKLLLTTFTILILGPTSVAGWIYWTTQLQVKEAIYFLKTALAKTSSYPESARFRSLRLLTDEGTVVARMKQVDMNFLWESTPQEVLLIFRYDPEALYLCGEVNAKNDSGTYIGYRPFWIAGRKTPASFVGAGESNTFIQKMCEIKSGNVVATEPDPS